MTIDELARESGMTTRNIRAHHARGLLPAPALRGRTAFYGREHVERLGAVRRLQQEGMSLEEITQLVERMPSGREAELLALARAGSGLQAEEPVVVESELVFAHWGEQATPELLDRVERLGHVRRLEDGRYEIVSPRLYRAAAELARLRVPLEAIVHVTEETWRHSDELAQAFLEMFIAHIAGPDHVSDDSDERLRVVERLRELAGDAVLAIFELAVMRAAGAALAREPSTPRRNGADPQGQAT
jgi:DNA-binding transcriptional MerR regulator